MNAEQESLELIRRVIDGTAIGADRDALQELLRNQHAVRRLYARYAHLDALLGSGGILLEGKPTKAVVVYPPRSLFWRSVTQVAAGLVFGMLCTSALMAYRPASAKMQAITLFSDGFEDSAQQWKNEFPDQMGVWGGALGQVISGSSNVQPFEGEHMARIEPAATTTLSYLERILDLQSLPVPQGNETRQIDVTASFHAEERGLRDRYTLRVAAFAETPENVRGQWVGREWREVEGALAVSKRALSTTAEDDGWQTISTVVEIPRGARSLVISLASGLFQNPDRKAPHYIDAVQATLLIGSQLPKIKSNKATSK